MSGYLDKLRNIAGVKSAESYDLLNASSSLTLTKESKMMLDGLINSKESVNFHLLKIEDGYKRIDEEEFAVECIVNNINNEYLTVESLNKFLDASKSYEANDIYNYISDQMSMEAGGIAGKISAAGKAVWAALIKVFKKLGEIVGNIIAAIKKFIAKLSDGRYEKLASQQAAIKAAIKDKTISGKTITSKANSASKLVVCKPTFFTSGIGQLKANLDKGAKEIDARIKDLEGNATKWIKLAASLAIGGVGAAGAAASLYKRGKNVQNAKENRKKENRFEYIGQKFQAKADVHARKADEYESNYRTSKAAIERDSAERDDNLAMRASLQKAKFQGRKETALNKAAFNTKMAIGAGVVGLIGAGLAAHTMLPKNTLDNLLAEGNGGSIGKAIIYGTPNPKTQKISIGTVINSLSFDVLSKGFVNNLSAACDSLKPSIAECSKAMTILQKMQNAKEVGDSNSNATKQQLAAGFKQVKNDIQRLSQISKDVLIEGLYLRGVMAKACGIALNSKGKTAATTKKTK